MITDRLLTILAAALLFCASSITRVVATESEGAGKTPLDATAILREIQLKVDKQQYEKVLTEINERELDLQRIKPETPGTAPEGTKEWAEKAKLILEPLETIAERLRERIHKNVADTNKRMELIDGEKQKAEQRPAAPERAERLQGKWEGSEVGRESEGHCTLEVTGNSLHFQGANKNEWYKATYQLVDGSPSQLRATITECPSAEFVGKSSSAIFKIENGKLTLAGNRPDVQEAPKSFAGDADSRVFVFTKSGHAK